MIVYLLVLLHVFKSKHSDFVTTVLIYDYSSAFESHASAIAMGVFSVPNHVSNIFSVSKRDISSASSAYNVCFFFLQ